MVTEREAKGRGKCCHGDREGGASVVKAMHGDTKGG